MQKQGGRKAIIRAAAPADYPTVLTLLQAANLPTDGVPPSLHHFFIAEAGGRAVAAIGLEIYGTSALLRSAVVQPAGRGDGVGRELVERLLTYARERGVGDVYLLTTTAEHYFPRFGFERIGREEVPEALQASAELRGACPASAVAMHRVEGGQRRGH